MSQPQFVQEPVVLSLRRHASDKSWGFALQGGIDHGLPVFVHKLTRNGIAHRSGMEPGDVILKICETPVTGMTHAQVKAEILRAGNDLDFTTIKRGFNVAQYNAAMNQQAAQQTQASSNAFAQQCAQVPGQQSISAGSGSERAEIVEEHLWKHGGPTFKNVQPKSYRILEQQLPRAEQSGQGLGSVFDKQNNERAPYLQAHEQTIQRAFGEQ